METALIPDFVTVVGSVAEHGDKAPHDVDILIRAERGGPGDKYVLLQLESLILAVRDTVRELTGTQELEPHILFGAQGPHDDYLRVGDLVIRWRVPERVMVKAGGSQAGESLPGDGMIGGGDAEHGDAIRTVAAEQCRSGFADVCKARQWPKPAVRFYTEHATPKQLWDAWGATRAPFAVEPKLNGFRCQVEKRGQDVKVFFEDTETDRANILQPLVERLREVPHDFVIDGDIGISENGKRWPRPALAALLGKEFDWTNREPVLTAFDILELDGEDLRDLPFVARREKLVSALGKYELVIPQAIVHTERELERAFAVFSTMPQSEGIVAKTLDAPYPSGPTNEWSKVKVRQEVRVRVAGVRVLKNGLRIYLGEWADGGKTGWSMPTKIEAGEGDVITVATTELNKVLQRGAPGGWSVTWTNGVVQDKTNDPPYTRKQALIIAARYLATAKAKIPFSLPGSKWRAAPKLIPYFPEHRIYVEPYAGTGAVLLRKPRSPVEYLNDIDELKFRALRFYQQGTKSDFEEFVARDFRFNTERAHQIRRGEFPVRADIDAAYVLAYSAIAMATGEPHSCPLARQRRDSAITLEDCLRWHNRLAGVRLMNEDALKIIRELDSPDTFFFIDPPYPDADKRLYGEHGPSEEHFQQLLETLRFINGKFLMTISLGALKGKQLPPGWHVRRIKMFRSVIGAVSHRYEAIVTNYDPDTAFAANLKYYRKNKRYPWEGQEQEAEKTRGEVGESYWEKYWMVYRLGRGKFVAQHHWRGLSKDEVDLPEEELLRRGHSVHLDIRFTSPFRGKLWGIHVFYESDRPGLPIDQLQALEEGEAMRGGPKLIEPAEWFDIARKRRYIAEPGESGSTAKKYSVIVEVDRGVYEAGVWNRHYQEIRLMGKRLRGDFALQRAEPGLWFVKRLRAPVATVSSPPDVIRRLRERGHKLLIWAKPGEQGKRVIIKRALPGKGVFRALSRLLTGTRDLQFQTIGYKIIGDWIVVPSSNCFEDTDGEFVTRKAIQEYVKGKPSGTIRIWHVPGTDFADVVFAFSTPHYLFHVARIRNDPFSQRVKQFLLSYPNGHPTIAPYGWGTSMRFVGALEGGTDYRRIYHIETSILPVHRAANPWVPRKRQVRK